MSCRISTYVCAGEQISMSCRVYDQLSIVYMYGMFEEYGGWSVFWLCDYTWSLLLLLVFVLRSMVLVYHCYNCIMMHTCSCNKKRSSCANCKISVFIKTEKYLTCVTSDMISDVTFYIRNPLRKSLHIGCYIQYDIRNDIISGVTSNTISETIPNMISGITPKTDPNAPPKWANTD